VESSFTDLIRRVRNGDAEAAALLVRHYGPAVRRVVRIRLVGHRLRQVLDSMDIYQSVLGSFFVRAALGQYDLQTPEHLLKLLTTMVRNKVISQDRHEQALGRRPGHGEVVEWDGQEPAARDPSPSQQAAVRELFQKFCAQLSAEERQLMDLRAQGKSWEEIAAELGGTPDAHRMRLGRIADRAARQFGLDGEG
jgi:RNA polymerase sigma-70 factor (ECF subfamily)